MKNSNNERFQIIQEIDGERIRQVHYKSLSYLNTGSMEQFASSKDELVDKVKKYCEMKIKALSNAL